jgi:hypothetical protein
MATRLTAKTVAQDDVNYCYVYETSITLRSAPEGCVSKDALLDAAGFNLSMPSVIPPSAPPG